MSSLESLFCDLKIDELNFFGLAVVEDVFGFDISMGDISIVDISDGSNNLPNNVLELLFIFYLIFCKIWTADILHD
jgi:hypothetical protein